MPKGHDESGLERVNSNRDPFDARSSHETRLSEEELERQLRQMVSRDPEFYSQEVREKYGPHLGS